MAVGGGLVRPNLVRSSVSNALTVGAFLDTFTETGPGDISQGVPHTPNIDQNPSGLDWVESLSIAPGGLANIDSAIDALVPIVEDGTKYGGAQQFRLADVAEFELVIVGDVGSIAATNLVTASITDVGATRVIESGFFPAFNGGGNLGAGCSILTSQGDGVLADSLTFAVGSKSLIVALSNGILGIKLDARPALYCNMRGVLTSANYRHLISVVSSIVVGTLNSSINVRAPTLAIPAGGSGDFEDLFDQNGLITASTPVSDPFGAGWQPSAVIPGSSGPPTIAGGKLTWDVTPESADVPLGGFDDEVQIEIPIDFGSDDGAFANALIMNLGQFGTGIGWGYTVQTGGTEVKIDMVEVEIGAPAVTLKSVVYANPASGVLKMAYKRSTGTLAHQLDANDIETVATAQVITPRHMLIVGVRVASAHDWGSIKAEQVATIL